MFRSSHVAMKDAVRASLGESSEGAPAHSRGKASGGQPLPVSSLSRASCPRLHGLAAVSAPARPCKEEADVEIPGTHPPGSQSDGCALVLSSLALNSAPALECLTGLPLTPAGNGRPREGARVRHYLAGQGKGCVALVPQPSPLFVGSAPEVDVDRHEPPRRDAGEDVLAGLASPDENRDQPLSLADREAA